MLWISSLTAFNLQNPVHRASPAILACSWYSTAVRSGKKNYTAKMYTAKSKNSIMLSHNNIYQDLQTIDNHVELIILRRWENFLEGAVKTNQKYPNLWPSPSFFFLSFDVMIGPLLFDQGHAAACFPRGHAKRTPNFGELSSISAMRWPTVLVDVLPRACAMAAPNTRSDQNGQRNRVFQRDPAP